MGKKVEQESKASIIRTLLTEHPNENVPAVMKMFEEKYPNRKISPSEFYGAKKKLSQAPATASISNGHSPANSGANIAAHVGNLRHAVADLGVETVAKLVKVLG